MDHLVALMNLGRHYRVVVDLECKARLTEAHSLAPLDQEQDPCHLSNWQWIRILAAV